MSEQVTKLDVEKFDGKGDFSLWKHKITCQLQLLHLDKCIKEQETSAADAKDGEVKKGPMSVEKDAQKELRAKNLISLCLSNSILRKVMKEPTALAIWKALERDYQQRALPNRIYLKQRFASYRMDASKGIEDNYNDFLKLVDDLAALNVIHSDEDQAIQLLSSLPPQYEPLVHSLKYGGGKDTLTINDVINSAYSKEIDLREQGLSSKSRSDAEGLYVESRGNSGDRFNNGNSGQQGGGRSQSKPKYNKGCFICGEEDHWKKDCPKRRYYKPKESANIAEEPKQPLVLTVSEQDTKGEWILDSGCQFHLTSDRGVLFDLEEFDGDKVLMANNTECEVKGIGKIKIQRPNGSEVILTGVRYMPGMKRNLISYGKLEDAGCNYEGRNYIIQFYKGGKLALCGKRRDGLYYLQGKVLKAEKVYRKKKSKKGPSPKGFDAGSTTQGGDSSYSENSEEVEFKEDGVVGYALTSVRESDTKIQGVKQHRQNGIEARNSRNLAAKEGVVLPKDHHNKSTSDLKTECLPGSESSCCDFFTN